MHCISNFCTKVKINFYPAFLKPTDLINIKPVCCRSFILSLRRRIRFFFVSSGIRGFFSISLICLMILFLALSIAFNLPAILSSFLYLSYIAITASRSPDLFAKSILANIVNKSCLLSKYLPVSCLSEGEAIIFLQKELYSTGLPQDHHLEHP